MASSSKSPVTLPSIKEMFPGNVSLPPQLLSHLTLSIEHMMQGLYESHTDPSRNSSAVPIKREQTPESATPRPGRLVTDVAHPTVAHYQENAPRQGPSQSQSPQYYHRQRGPTQEPLDIRHSYPATNYPTPIDTRPQSSRPYSFDLLISNAATSSLDTIATSQNVAYQPRPAYSVYSPGSASISQEESSEMHPGSRPSFRIHLPQDNAALYSMHGPSSGGMESAPGYQDSARYPSSPFIVTPSTPCHVLPSASRPSQSHVLDVPPYEEKKHCCPHCNKRFNRPSSLNIHVNTHTGAKPFICPYPGCQRRFNVNSNMRRHYRNHVSNNRRRDAVARLVEPTPQNMPPTPPLSVSPTDTPVSHFSGSLPSSASSDASTPLPSRSPSPVPSYYPLSDEEGDWFPDVGNRYALSSAGPASPARDRVVSYFDHRGLGEVGPGLSRTTRRQRSRSSPVPPSTHRQSHHLGGAAGSSVRPMRPRSSSCNVPGCDCQPAPGVSTMLRPAFNMTSSAPRTSRSAGPSN
ncbi:hypothetical protein BDY19DRAFT_499212 [Irpex rosettiformis]|uniref:Uncharacterized protein n=1 Tax=Irpex rosettiformis TaxID=378272 RepID=A0ACB8UEA5_9APHY|nr:hypothetical protein BDY19DRAFT_499212 [Irpex rosettiformis]